MTSETKDSEVIDYSSKPLGNTELFPLALKFSPNGRHFSVISDKDYVISTSGVYRDTYAGSCADLAWSTAGDFAIKDGSIVKIYKSMKEEVGFKPGFSFENIYGGPYLAVKGLDYVCFYDFETQVFIRKVEITVKDIVWHEKKKFVALVCDELTYILKFNEKAVEDYIENVNNNEEEANEDGCEDALEPVFELKESVNNGQWFEDVFIYFTSKNKLNYLIDGQIFSITTLSGNFFMLGFYQNYNRIYFMNKSFQLISVLFPVAFINYQCKILKNELQAAEDVSFHFILFSYSLKYQLIIKKKHVNSSKNSVYGKFRLIKQPTHIRSLA